MVSDPVIEEMNYKDNVYDVKARHPDFAHLAVAIGVMMKESEAPNFVTMNLSDEQDTFEVTVRRNDGETPADKIERLTKLVKAQEDVLGSAGKLAVHILRNWPREYYEPFATHLLGDECQECRKKGGGR